MDDQDNERGSIIGYDVQQQVVDPLHAMHDEEVLSAMTLAREKGDSANDEFVKYRDEVIYRMRRGNLSNWTPPGRMQRDREIN